MVQQQSKSSKKSEFPKEAKVKINALKQNALSQLEDSKREILAKKQSISKDIELRTEKVRKQLAWVRTDILPKLNQKSKDTTTNFKRFVELTKRIETSKREIEELQREINPTTLRKVIEREKKTLEKQARTCISSSWFK
jgi:hypothetical protein